MLGSIEPALKGVHVASAPASLPASTPPELEPEPDPELDPDPEPEPELDPELELVASYPESRPESPDSLPLSPLLLLHAWTANRPPKLKTPTVASQCRAIECEPPSRGVDGTIYFASSLRTPGWAITGQAVISGHPGASPLSRSLAVGDGCCFAHDC
jgi:hypothetical protein